MVRIQRFGVLKTATVVALVYLLGAAIFFVPFALLALLVGTGRASTGSTGLALVVIVALVIVFYGAIGWVVTAIACAIYNIAAGWTGGIEMQLETVPAPPPPATWGPTTTSVPPTPPSSGSIEPPAPGPNQPPYAG